MIINEKGNLVNLQNLQIVGTSKAVLSAFCMNFDDWINNFGYFVEQFGDKKLKNIFCLFRIPMFGVENF